MHARLFSPPPPSPALQENGEPDYTDISKTENTRVSYPIYHIENFEPSGMGGHPNNVIFLTCDAFGVLPPVSRLSAGQVTFAYPLVAFRIGNVSVWLRYKLEVPDMLFGRPGFYRTVAGA